MSQFFSFLKVSKSWKQILKFSFPPKNERKYFCISALQGVPTLVCMFWTPDVTWILNSGSTNWAFWGSEVWKFMLDQSFQIFFTLSASTAVLNSGCFLKTPKMECKECNLIFETVFTVTTLKIFFPNWTIDHWFDKNWLGRHKRGFIRTDRTSYIKTNCCFCSFFTEKTIWILTLFNVRLSRLHEVKKNPKWLI